MVEISTISAALGSIKTAAEIARLIKDTGASLEQAEIKLRIADLISSLADAKIELAEIQVYLQEKDTIIDELKKQLKLQKSVVWEKPYYFVMDGEQKDGPFCHSIADKDQKLIRLQGGDTKAWVCQTCKSLVTDGNYVKAIPNRTARSQRF